MTHPRRESLALLAGFFLFSLPPRLEGQSTVPSGGTPPPGTTRIDVVKDKAGRLVFLLETFQDWAVQKEVRRGLEGLEADIQKQMPEKGGVLVVARIAVEIKGMREPRLKQLYALYIAGPGNDADDAWKKYEAIPLKVSADGPSWFRREFYTLLPPVMIWYPRPPDSVKLGPDGDVAGAREKIASLLASLKAEHEKEKNRLDLEWKGIEAQNKRLLEAKRKSGGKPALSKAKAGGDPEKFRQRELDRLRAFEEGERSAIAGERAAANAHGAALDRARRELAEHQGRRCPAGVLYENCTEHPGWKQDFKARLEQLQAEIGTRSSALARHQEAAGAREVRLPQTLEARRRKIEADARLLEDREETAAKEDKSSQAAQKAFRDRLKFFSEDSEQSARLQALIQEVERVLNSPALKSGVP